MLNFTPVLATTVDEELAKRRKLEEDIAKAHAIKNLAEMERLLEEKGPQKPFEINPALLLANFHAEGFLGVRALTIDFTKIFETVNQQNSSSHITSRRNQLHEAYNVWTAADYKALQRNSLIAAAYAGFCKQIMEVSTLDDVYNLTVTGFDWDTARMVKGASIRTLGNMRTGDKMEEQDLVMPDWLKPFAAYSLGWKA